MKISLIDLFFQLTTPQSYDFMVHRIKLDSKGLKLEFDSNWYSWSFLILCKIIMLRAKPDEEPKILN